MNIDYPDNHQIPALQHLWQQAFGDDSSFLTAFFSTGFSPSRCRCLTLDGQLAAALYWFDCEANGQKLSYLYAIATEKSYQNRGLCRRLMENTHTLLKEKGYHGAILVPGEKGLFSFYEKIGYHSFGGIRDFSVSAGNRPISFKKITAEAYGSLRKAFLPQGGVRQEGETLSFLATQNNFYSGEDFLFTVAKDKKSLFVSELLGNTSVTPQIVCALGASSGHFRTVGTEPFGMCYPLSSALQIPTYFGLALD